MRPRWTASKKILHGNEIKQYPKNYKYHKAYQGYSREHL